MCPQIVQRRSISKFDVCGDYPLNRFCHVQKLALKQENKSPPIAQRGFSFLRQAVRRKAISLRARSHAALCTDYRQAYPQPLPVALPAPRLSNRCHSQRDAFLAYDCRVIVADHQPFTAAGLAAEGALHHGC